MKKQEKKQPLSRSALRRIREKEERAQSILKAAETLFAREGYHQTSMEQIADQAEIAVGTLYVYFKNKEDLLIRLLDEISLQLRTLLGTEFKKAEASLDGVQLAGQTFFEEFCVKYPEKVAIMLRESVGQSPLVEEHRKKIFDKFISDVLNAITRVSENLGVKLQSDFSAEVVAVSIMGIYERIAYQYLISQDSSKDLKVIGWDAVSFIVGGINNLFSDTK
jgi:AcrR family transcriptional regulator